MQFFLFIQRFIQSIDLSVYFWNSMKICRYVSSVYLYPFILIDIAILTLLTLSVAMISIKVIKDSNQI